MSQIVSETNVANDPKVVELVALAAAVGSNCEACFRSHHKTARSVGLSTEEIVRAVSVAEGVKETPARRMRELAARILDVPVAALSGASLSPAAAPAELAGDAEAEAAAAGDECC